MQANRGVDSLIERQLRAAVHRAGLRYSIDSKPVPEFNRRADIVFRTAKVAVYVNGCFWHGCLRHYKPPKTNSDFWVEKIRKNRTRDKNTRDILKKRGWVVLTFWEHQDMEMCAKKTIEIVRKRRPTSFEMSRR
jgi:DNA mismatch endonuclease (patch repair protein)